VKEVLVKTLGALDYIIRYEFQGRGAIHAHLLLVLPMELGIDERKLAFSKLTKAQEKWAYADVVSEVREKHGDIIPFFELDELFVPSTLVGDIMKARLHVIRVVGDYLGLTECHPSDHRGDWFPEDGGSLMHTPSPQVIRQGFLARVHQGLEAVVNLINLTMIHRCRRSYCLKIMMVKEIPKTIPVHLLHPNDIDTAPQLALVEPCPSDDGPAEPLDEANIPLAHDYVPPPAPVEGAAPVNPSFTRVCRFGFPMPLVGFKHVVDESGTRVERCEPLGYGKIETCHENLTVFKGKVCTQFARNHKRTVCRQEDGTLIWGANTCWMWLQDPKLATDYMLKYITKGESDSEGFINFAREAFEEIEENELKRFVHRVLLHHLKEHDYSLSEANLILNRGCPIIFSRPFVVINPLGDGPVSLDGDNQAPITKKSLGDIYDGRFNDKNFLMLKEKYEDCNDDNKPCSKHPEDYSLYEFAACFTKDWIPEAKYKVVHTVPYFRRAPNKDTSPEWFKKYALCMIRLHAIGPPCLDDLEFLNNDTLLEIGNDIIYDDVRVPQYIKDHWLTIGADLVEKDDTLAQHLVGEDEILENDIGNICDFAVENALNDQEEPIDPAILDEQFEDDNVFDHDDASDEFDKLADKLLLCPEWNRRTADTFCADVLMDVCEMDEPPALPFVSLTEHQARTVLLLRQQFHKILHSEQNPDQPHHQFFLDLCGSAGVGKTTIMCCFKEILTTDLQQHPSLAINDLIHFAAPTGTAAQLLPSPCSTLHRLLSLPINSRKDSPIEDLSETSLKERQYALEKLRLLIIDEKSFIGARMLYEIDQRLQQIKNNTIMPIGGVSIVLMGDFKQLAPVKDFPLYTPCDRRGLTHFQQCGLLRFRNSFNESVVLQQVHRQSSDPLFAQVLSHFVEGQFNIDDWTILSHRALSMIPDRKTFEDSAVYLCAYKADFRQFNLNKVDALGTPKILIDSENEPFSGQFVDMNDAGGLPRRLLIARQMRVMLTANINVSMSLTNGAQGTIVGIIFYDLNDNLPHVLVQFDRYTGRSCLPDMERVYPVRPITRTFHYRKQPHSRTMLPLLPAYAFSIHKSQGQTLDKVIINLGKKEFATGLTYTALSRVRCLADLAFDPMPSLERIEKIKRTKGFALQQAEARLKLALQVTLPPLYEGSPLEPASLSPAVHGNFELSPVHLALPSPPVNFDLSCPSSPVCQFDTFSDSEGSPPSHHQHL
jgi:ATP-dependent DNA helicase PIF1